MGSSEGQSAQTKTDPRLLEAAKGKDEAAYERLVEPHRSELHAHCYRMLGSVQDADDALQDALLRAWRNLERFEGRSSLRHWLYRIATNTSLDVINKRNNRILPIDEVAAASPEDDLGRPLSESILIEPYPDSQYGIEEGYDSPESRFERRESLELAFIAALQHLPVRQRGVLIMREVLGFSAKETAEALDMSVASVNSALQRARAAIDERVPDQSQQETLRSLGDDKVREIVEGYMEAMSAGDVERVVGMVTDDIAWSMPPAPTWFKGKEDVREFLRKRPLSGDWRWKQVPTTANGQLAIGEYTYSEELGCYQPFGIDVLELEADRIRSITSFIIKSPDVPVGEELNHWPDHEADEVKLRSLFDRFGLPRRLD